MGNKQIVYTKYINKNLTIHILNPVCKKSRPDFGGNVRRGGEIFRGMFYYDLSKGRNKNPLPVLLYILYNVCLASNMKYH